MQTISEDIEEHAAKEIGFIIFEFTRLDMELGLCLAWADEGKELKSLTTKLAEKNFHYRLILLEKLVSKKYEKDTAESIMYRDWIHKAHAVRTVRNQLVHGRWGFIPQDGCFANVIGLPTSAEQSETRYTIKQLNRVVKNIQNLRSKLNELRKECHI